MKKILAAAVLAALSVGSANAALSFSNAEQPPRSARPASSTCSIPVWAP